MLRFKWTIRSLLLAIAACAVLFAWLGHRRSIALSEAEALSKMDCMAFHMYDYDPDFNIGATGIPSGPHALRSLFHDHIFSYVASLCMQTPSQQDFARLKSFGRLLHLTVEYDNSLKSLSDLDAPDSVAYLCLHNNQMESLAGAERFPNLEIIDLKFNPKLAEISALDNAPKLRELWINGNVLLTSREIGRFKETRPNVRIQLNPNDPRQ